MIVVKNILSGAAIALLLGTGALVATAGTASARMVCNNSGDCWHTEDNNNYKYPGTGYTRHPDDWYFHQTWTGSSNQYRDYHAGRGYYKSGIWIGF